jgi:hypothetical protein
MLHASVASLLCAAAERCAVRSMTAAARSSDVIRIICPPLQSARDRRLSRSPPVLCRVPRVEDPIARTRRHGQVFIAAARPRNRAGPAAGRAAPPALARGFTIAGGVAKGDAMRRRNRGAALKRRRSRSGRCVTVPAAPNRRPVVAGPGPTLVRSGLKGHAAVSPMA